MSPHFERSSGLHTGPATNGSSRWQRPCRLRCCSRQHNWLSSRGLCPSGDGLSDELIPNASWDIAPGDIPGRAVVVVSDPNSDHDVGREAYEPRIPVLLRRVCFSRSRDADPGCLARPLTNNTREKITDGDPRGLIGRNREDRFWTGE